jgi:hypothetical protein
VARELMRNHKIGFFSERIKTMYEQREVFYPIDKDKQKKGGKDDDSD